MACLVALIIFSFLGIFSLSYRKLAKEALACLFRKFSLRPCQADFQLKIKTKVIGYLLRKNFKGTNFIYQQYETLVSLFSLIFLIIFSVSGYLSVQGLYNLIVYGYCDLANPQNCPFSQGEICIFSDEMIIKELKMPLPADASAALIYQRLPTIAQKRILIRASQELSPNDLAQFEKLLKEGDGFKIQKFLSKKIPHLRTIIGQELERLKKDVLESLDLNY